MAAINVKYTYTWRVYTIHYHLFNIISIIILIIPYNLLLHITVCFYLIFLSIFFRISKIGNRYLFGLFSFSFSSVQRVPSPQLYPSVIMIDKRNE